MNATLTQQGVISNNLANINTVGFKQGRALNVEFHTHLFARLHDQRLKTFDGTLEIRPTVGVTGGGVVPQEVATDYVQGSRFETHNKLDFALTGKGTYFTVQGPGGQALYTRNGNFNLDADGRLVTQDGYAVMGHNGEVFIDGSEVAVDAEGNVSVDGKELDSILVAKVSDETRLEKVGHSLFKAPATVSVDYAPNEEDVLVQQGFLEQSNVNPVSEMVQMIEASRLYELNARVITMYDNAMGRAALEVGSLRV
jgi:flagellar basal-body rod protein FlgF